MVASKARSFGVLIAGCALGAAALSATPAAADTTPGYGCVVETAAGSEPATLQPLQVCASFDKSSYLSGDTVKLTVSVQNLGNATASDVYLPDFGSGYSFVGSGRGLFLGGLVNGGIDLPPGATTVVEEDGASGEPASGVVEYSTQIDEGSYSTGGGTSRYVLGPGLTISASVTAVTASYSGVVFTDTNGNGVPDPGEGLAGTQITLFGVEGAQQPSSYTATSDAQGVFQFTGLPAGQYTESINAPSGWVVPSPEGSNVVTVDGSPANTNVLYPARRPLSGTLHASIAFDKKTYQVGDTAGLTVTLTNSGSTDLPGIQAGCDHDGSSEDVSGTGIGWDALRGSGVDVPAGQSTTVNLTEVIPTRDSGGTIYAECAFGPDVANFGADYPDPTATATATEATGPTTGFTMHVVVDNPLAVGWVGSLRLLDPASQDPVAVAGDGGTVSGLPAGTYDLQTVDGVSLASGQASTLSTADVTSGQTVTVHVLVTGPQPAPPTPPTD